MIQGTLFDLEPNTRVVEQVTNRKAKKPESSKITYWSHSKIEMLNSCPRKFYYKYFGGKKTRAKEEPEKERLELLETLTNQYMLCGSIVHDEVAAYFESEGQKSFRDAKQSVRQKLNNSIKLSEDLRQGRGKPTFWVKPVKEIFYDSVPKKEFLEFCEERIINDLENFLQCEEFEQIRTGGIEGASIVEKRAVFPVSDRVKVDGRIDLAFWTESDFHIIDWKTSVGDYEETSLQLLGYAVWAIEQEKIDQDKIMLGKAYLTGKWLESLEFSSTHLLRARMRILQDAERISEMEHFGEEGIMEAFDKNPSKICDLCPFQEVCENKNQ